MMSNAATPQNIEENKDSVQEHIGERDTLYQTLAGLGFFVILGLASIIAEWPRDFFSIPTWLSGAIVLLGVYLIIVIGFGIGWMKGFPRWSFPYAVYTIIFALYWMSVATPGLKIFNHTFQRNELWGWRAWIPFIVIAFIVLIATRSLRPLVRLGQNVWNDWTRLSFGMYGMLPLFVLFLFDEVKNSFQFPFMLLSTLILTVGALLYMRSISDGCRVLSLAVSTALIVLMAAVGNGFYWHGRQESWMATPANGYSEALGVITMGIVVILVIFSPTLLWLCRSKKSQLAG